MAQGHVVDLLHTRAESAAEATAFTFLRSDDTAETVTYGELRQRVWRISALLHDSGLRPGDRVLVTAPPGLDYVAAFLGSLHAGCVAVPAFPPRGSRHDERLGAIVRDCAPAIALGTAEVRDRARRGGRVPIDWRTVEEAAVYAPDAREPATAPDGVAFLQYTSGSTGAPKGVVVTHLALLANLGMIARNFALTPDDIAVSWLPPYHDMGLVGGLLAPIFGGIPCVLMAPAAFAQAPASWLRTISRFRATISGGPDFGYRQCVERIGDDELAGLDLSSWRLAFTGAEPVRARTIRRFTERFQPYGFSPSAPHPCYGLAEATLMVAGSQAGEPVVSLTVDPDELGAHRVSLAEAGVELISSGQPECPIRIVAPDGEDAGGVGEIWVGGDAVASGYWGRPEESAATFPGSWVRTGDLGFLAGGELFVTGRVKDVIIVRGRNIYPQDVEDHVAAAHPDLGGGAVAAFPVSQESGAEGFAVAVEVDRHAAADDVRQLLDRARQAVVEGIGVAPAALAAVPRAALPRTSSGKLQRGLTRRLFESGELATIAAADAAAAPATAADPALLAAAEEVLGPVPGGVPLTRLGLDSLAAARLVEAARRRGVEVDLEQVLGGASLAELTPLRHRPAVRTDLSTVQSFWLHEQIVPGTAAYTTAVAVRLPSDVDPARLEGALRLILARHPVLRSRFTGPGPSVHIDQLPPRALSVEAEVAPEHLDSRLTGLAAVPMPMSGGGLVRAHLLPVRAADPVLLLLAHHAVADLWSAGVLLRELNAAYRGLELPPAVAATPEGRAPEPPELDWWRERLAGIADRAALPADRPAGRLPTHRGRTLRRTTSGGAAELAQACAATRFAVQLAGAAILIARHAGSADVAVGVPLANRDPARADAVGNLVTVVPVRMDLDRTATVGDAVRVARDALAASVARAHVPLDELAALAGAGRLTGRHPLVDVAVVDHTLPLPVDPLGLVREILPVDRGAAAFDVSILFGAGTVELEYAVDRFEDGTAGRLGDRLAALLAAMEERPGADWRELPLDADLPPYAELRSHVALPEADAVVSPKPDRMPSGRWEEGVARAFGEVLGYGPVAASDDFFDFGGSSLAASQVAGLAAGLLGVDVTVRDVYEASTVEKLAARLSEREPASTLQAPIRRQPRRAQASA